MGQLMHHMGTKPVQDKNKLSQIPQTVMPWPRGCGAAFPLSCAHVKLGGTASTVSNVAPGRCVPTTGGGDQGQPTGPACLLPVPQLNPHSLRPGL